MSDLGLSGSSNVKHTMTDGALLTEYARNDSEPAFRDLAGRYTDLVHSAALRQVNDSHLAKDVTQQVFICLARKAHSLTKAQSIVGWLYRATHLEALKLLRERSRRTQREIHAIGSLQNDSAAGTEPDWHAIAPLLDEALNCLRETERDAVLMRFFERKTLREVAGVLGISEDAAQKRVARALESLRVLLARRGASVSAGGLAAVLSTQAVQTAPAGLANAVAGAIAGGTLTAGASFFPSALNLMATSTKLKIAIVASAAVTAITVPFVLSDSTTISRQAPPRDRVASAVNEPGAESYRSELETLRLEVAELRKARPESSTNPSPATVETREDSLEAIRKRALDSSNSVDDRLAALSSLRTLNARDAEVVSAMMILARESLNPAVRADIFRQLNGVTDIALRAPLQTALESDQSASVRSEAAETLAAFRDDPAIKAMLQKAARGDANHEVRISAAESLLRGQSAGVLAGVIGDLQSTDVERYGAAAELRKLVGPSTEQAKVLVEIVRSSSMPKLREEAVEDLARHYGDVTGVLEWMQHLAANDPNSKVQEEASEFLEERRR